LDLGRAVFAAMGTEPKIDFVDTPADIRDKYQYFTEAKMEKLVQCGLPRGVFYLGGRCGRLCEELFGEKKLLRNSISVAFMRYPW
jgi:hypothetical protein